MTNSFIDTTVETTSSGVDAFDMPGAEDTLLLASSGSLVALGAGASGLSMTGANEVATLDGLVYSAEGSGVSQLSGEGSEIEINGEVDSATSYGVDSEANGAEILVNGTVYGGGTDGLLMAGTGSIAIVNGTVTGLGIGLDAGSDDESIHVNGTVGSLTTQGYGILAGNATSQNIDIGAHADVYGGEAAVAAGGEDTVIKNSGHLSGGVGFYAEGSSDVQFINDGFASGALLNGALATTIQNSGLISTGSGPYAIEAIESSTATSIENAGTVRGGLLCDEASTVTVQNSGNWHGSLLIQSSSNSVTNDGAITGGIVFGTESIAVTGNSVINDGTIHSGLVFFAESEATSDNTVSNAGTIYGGVVFNEGAGVQGNDTLGNSGTIYGTVKMGAEETLTNTGTIHGNVFFATGGAAPSDDTFDNSNGIVIGSINGGSGGDTFIIGAGNNIYNPGGKSDHFDFGAGFGNDVINNFSTSGGHDIIQFSGGDFTSWSELQSHMTQVGANTVIALEPGSTIELTHTLISHLVASEFIFT